MNFLSRSSRVIAIAVIIGLTGLAGLGYYVFQKDVEEVRRSSNEAPLWSANQIDFELIRFIQALTAFEAGIEDVGRDDVNHRFDILWSRLSTANRGVVGDRISEFDQTLQSVTNLFQDVRKYESDVIGLQDGDAETAKKLLAIFEPHVDSMRELSLRVLFGQSLRDSELRANMRTSATIAGILSMSAVLLSIALLFFLFIENRRMGRLAARNLALAETAQRANEAKSRFLTMMSHELRTPMNGVLGMLALAKGPGLPTAQLRMVEQAERSGRDMIDLLADMIDFSALQDDALELSNEPFSTKSLIDTIDEQFGALARREAVAFAVRARPGSPARISGDFARLRQIYTHLCTYVVSTAGTKDIVVELGHEDGNVVGDISFSYGTDGSVWKPDLILGAPDRQMDQFASDALGPAVVRMLVGHMDGTIALEETAPGRMSVIVKIPAVAAQDEELVVRMEARTGAIKSVAMASLRSDSVSFFEGESSDHVDAVLLEVTGGPEDEAMTHNVRYRFPNAVVVALGVPVNASLYDHVADFPLNLHALRDAIAQRHEGPTRSRDAY